MSEWDSGGAKGNGRTVCYGGAGPEKVTRQGGALRPPDLLIQGGLPWFAGPLGTMAGLDETAIEAL